MVMILVNLWKNQEIKICLFKNKHDGLMFFLLSHGYRGKVLYYSECKEYKLDNIFSMYSLQVSSLLKAYIETEQESNHLLLIPKIFFLDMCRGQGKAKITQIGREEKNETQTPTTTITTMDDENKKQKTKCVVTNEMKEEKSKPRNEKEIVKRKVRPEKLVVEQYPSTINSNKKKKESETFVLKRIQY